MIEGNIHYHHMPYSTQERLGRATDFIDTKYTIFLCDDEFYVPSALEHCIERLEEDDELVSCSGRCLGFYHYKDRILAQPIYTSMKDHKVLQDTSRERMLYQMNPYVQSTFFSVMRSNVWKTNMRIISNTVTMVYANEIQFELATCYQGKSLVLDELMWLRNMSNPPIQTSQHVRNLQFHDWIQQGGDEVDFFYESTARRLAEIDDADPDQVLIDFKDAINMYLYYCKVRGL